MPRKYITTGVVGAAHKSDILGVAVCKRFTVTCSADGFLKLWRNDTADRALASEQFVHSLGLHHVSVFEDTIDGEKVVLVATVAFSGQCYVYKSSEKGVLSELETAPLQDKSYWVCQFGKGTTDGQNSVLVLTTVGGETDVYTLSKTADTLAFSGTAYAQDASFANAAAISMQSRLLAVGHQNGCVYLYEVDNLKLLYRFEAAGLQGGAQSTVRSVSFSPNGATLAVACDSGASGTVTLYDVKYGETVGTLSMPTHSAAVGIGSYTHPKWCLSLSFNEDGDLLATGGLESKIRIWNVETRESEAVLTLAKTDVGDAELAQESPLDIAGCSSLSFIPKGANAAEGSNDGLVLAGFDRAVRWFREAGGV